MFQPEKFGPSTSRHPETGEPLSDEFGRDDSRRGILFAFLERAGADPNVLRDGLDTAELNRLISGTGGDVEFVPSEEGDPRISDLFMARFHPGVKYAPLSAIEGAPEGALTYEMRALKAFMPFLRNYLRTVAETYGVTPDMPDDRAIIIGFDKRKPETELLGGYHASLNEQGYKLLDATLQENIRLAGAERPEYRVVDLLRTVAHDATHYIQYKRFGRWSAKLRRVEEKLRIEQDADKKNSLQQEADGIRDRLKESDIDIQQYGLAMIGRDHAIEIDGATTEFNLGAALFEYVTDEIAREGIAAYLKQQGQELPEPMPGIETLMQKDLRGERILERDLEGLSPEDHKTGKYMVEYGKNILAPAEEILRLVGPLKDEFFEAMKEAVFTGKYRKIKQLKGRIGELSSDDADRLRSYAKKGAVFLRPLFSGETTSV